MISAPVSAFHILTVLSLPPDTILMPSGLYDIDQIGPSWPESVISFLPLEASETLMSLPSAEMMRWASGLNEANPPAPSTLITLLPVAVSHIPIFLPPVTIYLPSGLNPFLTLCRPSSARGAVWSTPGSHILIVSS